MSFFNHQPLKKQFVNSRYILHEELRRGDVGTVYKATDRLTGRMVSFKRLPAHTPSINEAIRLHTADTFQTLAGLRHPNIVEILDYGFDADLQPFLTTTYYSDPETILDAINGKSIHQKTDYICQILQTLVYLHQRGILHRNLRPENIFIQNDVVQIFGFDLVENTDSDFDRLHNPPLYLAPESLDDGSFTAASELYAVGIICYLLLTGRHPFAPFDDRFLGRVMTGEPNLRPIPSQVRSFIQQLMAKEPSQRPANAHEALAILTKTLDLPNRSKLDFVPDSRLESAQFIGRESEINDLNQALNSAAKGNGSAWLIGGESGVGKSRLLQEIQTKALVNRFQVLRGQGRQDGVHDTYQIWQDPLKLLLLSVPTIDDLTASVLLPIMPDIEHLVGRSIPPAPKLDDEGAQKRLYNTVASLFAHTSDRPILLILEDLHWALGSLALLEYLMRSVPEKQLLIIGSYRSDKQDQLKIELPNTQHLMLQRLNDSELSDLTTSMLGDVGKRKDILHLVKREADGNTFFAVEIARALVQEAGGAEHVSKMKLPTTLFPNGIRDVVNGRLEKIPDHAKALLTLTAVAGLELDLRLIEYLGKEIDVRDWWLPLCANTSILKRNKHGWSFAHSKIREGLLDQISAEDLANAHRDVAEGLEKIHPDSPQYASRLAYHWRHAQNRDKERFYAIKAGDYAAEQFSNDDAIAHLSRAIELTPQEETEQQFNIRLKRADIYDLIGDRDHQFMDLTALVILTGRLKDLRKRALIASKEATYFHRTGQYDKMIQSSELVIQLGKTLNDIELVGDGHVIRGDAARTSGDLDTAQTHLEYSASIFERSNNLNKLSRAYNALGITRSFQGDTDAELDYFEKSLRLAQQLNDVKFESRLYNNLSLYHAHQSNYIVSRSYLDHALKRYREIGDRFGEAIAYQNKGISLYTTGDYQGAFIYEKMSANLFEQLGDFVKQDYSLLFLTLIAEKTGRFATVRNILEASVKSAKNHNRPKSENERLILLGFISMMRGQFDKANLLFNRVLTDTRVIQNDTWVHYILYHRGRMAMAQSDWQEGASHFEVLVEAIKEKPLSRLYNSAKSGLALMRMALGDIQKATALAEPIAHTLLESKWSNSWLDLRSAAEVARILKSENPILFRKLVTQAVQTLSGRAALLDDDSSKRFYLDRVPEHSELMIYHDRLLDNPSLGASPATGHPTD